MRETFEPKNFLCPPCAEVELGYGSADCDVHGNEFIDHKCSFCCSIALFVTENGNRFHCQPCFNSMMEKKKVVSVKCTGGPTCNLKITRHAQAPAKFPLGCALCRSEKLEIIVREADVAGFNVETRKDLLNKHGRTDNKDEMKWQNN